MSPINYPKIYNPANQSREELIQNFVVRTEIFHEIFNDLATSEMKYPEQHYIIQGVRGQGKTTLLLRLAYGILEDKALHKRLIPVIFNEEQYHISRLYKLWETTADYLEEYGEIKGLYREMQSLDDDDDYERRCFDVLVKGLKKTSRKLILFIDNIDDLLKKLSPREHQRLREIFSESAEIRIIGASSVSLEYHYDYGHSFYQFFKMPQLKGLSTEETRTLLLKLGQHYKRARVKKIIEKQPGRVEALRRLTDGVIRTIILLYEIFVDDKNGNAFIDLEKILDAVTPLYKHRMDNLPPQQQEIVDFIALSWDAVGTGEIAKKTKIPSKAVSAQLKQLEKYHIVEKLDTSTKNFLYRISERFFNIWYLMRHGRKWDEKRVRFLVEFLQIWCDQEELEDRTRRHLNAIRSGGMYENQAFYLTEALVRTPIRRELQHELLSETRSYLGDKADEAVKHLSRSDFELSEQTKKAIRVENFDAAINCYEKISNKSVDEIAAIGAICGFSEKKDLEKAERYLQKAVEKDHAGAMYNLAVLYQTEFKDYKKAEKYYLKAVENNHADAMNNLAVLYETENKDYKKAEGYFLKAVENNHADAMNNLAVLYEKEFKDYKKAERYYLKAVKKDHTSAMNNLAVLYFLLIKKHKEKALELAQKAYVNDSDIYSAALLGIILLWNNHFPEAVEVSKRLLEHKDSVKQSPNDVSRFLLLLMAKKQYHLALKLFNENPNHLKDRFKPIYYALMQFLKDEYPDEFRKMGTELEETVNEIMRTIKQMEEDYA